MPFFVVDGVFCKGIRFELFQFRWEGQKIRIGCMYILYHHLVTLKHLPCSFGIMVIRSRWTSTPPAVPANWGSDGKVNRCKHVVKHFLIFSAIRYIIKTTNWVPYLNYRFHIIRFSLLGLSHITMYFTICTLWSRTFQSSMTSIQVLTYLHLLDFLIIYR